MKRPFALFILTLIIAHVHSRSSSSRTFTFGSKVRTCKNSQAWLTTSTQMLTFAGSVQNSGNNWNGRVGSLTMCWGTWQNAAVFYKVPLAPQNHFTAQFNMAIDSSSCNYYYWTTCAWRIFGWCARENTNSRTDRCSADGLAFILSTTPWLGGNGGCLGYCGLHNTLAIEFDTWANDNLNDPDAGIYSDRHVSVILKRGVADANENNAIAYNNYPVNFEDTRVGGYTQPSVSIQFYDGNLEVFMNNQLTVGYYNNLNIADSLGSPTFYFGLTAGTGALSERNIVNNLLIGVGVPDPNKSNIFAGSTSSFMPKEVFDIYANLITSCGQSYTLTDSEIDNMDQFSYSSPNQCVLAGKMVHNSNTVRMRFYCTAAGTYAFRLKSRGEFISGSVSVNVVNGPIASATVEFIGGNTKSIDSPMQFNVIPLDRLGNEATSDVNALKRAISIDWPNKADSQTNYEVKKVGAKYLFTISSFKLGKYSIKSSFFGSNVYEFTLTVGKLSQDTTFATLTDSLSKKLSNIVLAGTAISASLIPRDIGSNIISTSTISTSPLLKMYLNGEDKGDISTSKGDSVYNWNLTLTKSGIYNLKSIYSSHSLACIDCSIEVKPSPIVLTKSTLFSWNQATKSFIDSKGNFTLSKDDNFQFVHVLRDAYLNLVLSGNSPADFKITLSGNSMTELNLCLSDEKNLGIKLEICSKDKYYYSRLASKPDYIITVINSKLNLTATYSLSITSDGSFNDCGNGELDLIKTQSAWIINPNSGYWGVAGQTYTLSITLNTVEGLRHCAFLVDSEVTANLKFGFTRGEFADYISDAKKDSKIGVYLFDLNFKKASMTFRMITFAMGNYTIPQYRRLMIKEAPAFKAKILSEFLDSNTTLSSGIIKELLPFNVGVFDKFDNPSKAVDNDLNILGQHLVHKDITVNPKCSFVSLGEYYCTMTVDKWGTYALQNELFTNFFNSDYFVSFYRTEPFVAVSSGRILNDQSKPILAGESIKFRIVPKDLVGDPFVKIETEKIYSNFGLSVKSVGFDSTSSTILIKATDIDSVGNIIVETKLTKAKQHVFTATYRGQPILCEVCALTISPGPADIPSTKLFQLSSAGNIELNLKSTLVLNNVKILPVFSAEFYDAFGNSRSVETSFDLSQATLDVPSGAKTSYKFLSWNSLGKLRFSLSSELTAFYSEELANDKCSMKFEFSGTKTSIQGKLLIDSVVLQGKDEDKFYTNEPISLDKVVISPNSLSIKANEKATLSIELRAANSRLFNHPDTHGWYTNATASLKLFHEDIKEGTYTIVNGKSKGTYIATFTSTVAKENSKLAVSYQDPKTSTFLTAESKALLTVTPGDYDYLVLDQSTLDACEAGSVKGIISETYDAYNNVIPKVAPKLIGLEAEHESHVKDLNEQLSTPSNGVCQLHFSCTKAGKVIITAPKFKSASNYTARLVKNYNVMVVPGPPSPSNSLATVSTTKISAGQSVQWRIYPYDKFENKRVIDDNAVAKYSKLYGGSVLNQGTGETKTLDGIKVSGDKQYYYYELSIEKAGTHVFQATYDKELIPSAANKVAVAALPAEFAKSKLSKLDVESRIFIEYDKKFYQDIAALPEFKVLLFDKFTNPVNEVPTNWKLGLQLTGAELKGQEITFCVSNGNIFAICNNDKVKKSYSDLITNRDYTLNILENSNINGPYLMALTGDKLDPEASNLPSDISNTVITPSSTLETIAGVGITFNIEIRTTNKNLRRNEFFVNPSSNIKIDFSKKESISLISYDIKLGDKKGRYVVEVMSKKAFGIQDPCLITITIDNIKVAFSPKLIVKAAEVDRVLITDEKRSANVRELPTNSIDNVYLSFFHALDKFGNPILLGGNTKLDLKINGPNLFQAFDFNYLVNGVFKVSFQPKKAGDYVFDFLNDNDYKVNLGPGAISTKNSYGTIQDEGKIVAGDQATIVFYPVDKWGNSLALSSSLLTSAKLSLKMKLPSESTYSLTKSIGTLSSDSLSVQFKQQVTVKGENRFQILSGVDQVNMKKAAILCVPGEFSFPDSKMYYYAESSASYIIWYKSIPISEDNVDKDPIFLFKLNDKFQNEFDEFPEELKSKFTAALYGNDYDKANPIAFMTGKVQGNGLLITLDPKDDTRYRNGLFKETPYTFELIYSTKSLLFSVNLLGRGKGDKDAEIEKPMDITNTFVSPPKISFTAGLTSEFSIEIRTKSNKRKADAIPKFEFSFEDSDSSYKAEVIPAELRGKFLVTVSGTKATLGDYKAISFTIDKISCPKKVMFRIDYDSVNSVKIVTNLTNIGSADNEYEFGILPFDKFGNIVFNAKEENVNVQVKFPVNTTAIQGKSYSTSKAPQSGIITYKVKSTIAGFYTIKSGMLEAEGKFEVKAGIPNSMTSVVSVTPTTLRAGEEVKVEIEPFDKYNNKIHMADQSLEKTFNFDVGQLKDQAMSENSVTDKMQGSFKMTRAEVYSLQVQLGGTNLACKSCAITYLPGEPELHNTKMYVSGTKVIWVVKVAKDWVSSVFSWIKKVVTGVEEKEAKTVDDLKEISKLTIAKGTSDLSLRGKIYDAFENKLSEFTKTQKFVIEVGGNNMKVITLETTINSDLLAFSVPVTLQKDFARLVPAKDYQLNLIYSNEKGPQDNKIYLMDIEGEDDGAGNGPLDLNTTYLEKKEISLVAGVQGSILVELRQSQSKRFNGICSKDFFTASTQLADDLKIVVDGGQKNCQYIIKLYSTKATSQFKSIEFSADGKKLNSTLKVSVVPNKPDPTKTLLVKEIPKTAKTDEVLKVSISLRDEFENVITGQEFASTIAAKAISGNLDFQSTSLVDGNYVLSLFPLYPPRYLEFKLYMLLSANNEVVILNRTLSLDVETTLAPNKTQASPISESVDKSFIFNVKLNDVKGYCFETSGNVTIEISGPYESGEANQTKLSKGAAELKSKNYEALTIIPKLLKEVSREDYTCHRYYEISVPSSDFVKSGYYESKISLDSVHLATLRHIHLLPGIADPDNTLVYLSKKPKEVALSSENELSIYAGDEIQFKIQLQDKFRNLITKSSDEAIDISFSSHSSSDFTKEIVDNENGSFFINLIFKKSGEVKDIKLSVLKQKLEWANLEKSNFPPTLSISPLACSNEVNGISNELLKQGINQGEKVFFSIICYDKFGNEAQEQIYNFAIVFKGQEQQGGANEVKAAITPLNTKTIRYTASIRLTYTGNYTAFVSLNGKEYSTFNTLVSSRCPDSSPIYCVNSKKCVTSYKACAFPELENCSADKPFRCKVFGDSSCVRHKNECDCEAATEIKCLTDNKCVQADQEPILCATFFWKDCPEGTQKCADGVSCRKDLEACPSFPGCPPGHKICPDQSCVVKSEKCPVFKSCPPESWYKCEDQSCAINPVECPTRVSCGLDSIVCQDNTCASTEINCRLPATCPGMHVCPDLSCRPTQEDCPKAVTCPYELGLCQDNICRESCKGIKSMRIRLLAGRLLAESGTCKANEISCPGGECVANTAFCPTLPTCPIGSVTCPDGSCGASISECPSRTCKDGKSLCWDGKCVTTNTECPTRSTCPEELPVKCPDGLCVGSIGSCREVVPCPQSQSHRCANGECRRKNDECPSLVTCPTEFPIKCSDNSCVKSSESCKAPAELAIKCLDTEVVCPDASCSSSREFCPTIISCPIGYVKCYDGNCAESRSKCSPIEMGKDGCPTDKMFKCADGQCRSDLHDCPSGIICPLERPILCSDGNCKESIEQCVPGECPLAQSRCSDGSCSLASCPTAITCPLASPFKCSDGTCKRDPRDCPQNTLCPSSLPIKCGDGSCVRERRKCGKTLACEPMKPVKCPDANCVTSVTDCGISVGCPLGLFQCHDGSCRKDPFICGSEECPLKTIKCPSGECRKSASLCPTPDGCPFYLPFKCSNGGCVTDVKQCTEVSLKDKKGVLCPDGSIAPKIEACQLKNGCPSDLPVKCSGGYCVDGVKKKCDVLHCPSEKAIKCLDGTCVSTTNACPTFIPKEQFSNCLSFVKLGLFVPCGDGSCAPTADECPPLYDCPYEFIRCGDGSCRPDLENCPIVGSTCPTKTPFRCANGGCATSKDSCFADNGCPGDSPVKCSESGICATKQESCEEINKLASLSNGCPLAKPFKCSDNTCTSSKTTCSKVVSCPKDKFLCPDNSCESTKAECLKKKVGCGANLVLCPDLTCKSDFLLCTTTKGCPVTEPYSCDSGCSKTPCPNKIRCPPHRPFLCADGECQSNFALCRVVLPCENGIRCPDNSCASSLMKCSQLKSCPITNPIECGDGSCVASSTECKRIKSLRCPNEKPLKCLAGNCVTLASECIGDLSASKTSTTTDEKAKEKTRILAVSGVDPGCDSSNPNRCPDGSCKSNIDQCSLLSPCSIFKPVRCATGSCEASKKECVVVEKTLAACDAGLKRCEDGICRGICPAYFGCAIGQNQCADGSCAETAEKCIENAKCPDANLKVRCADGGCFADVSKCSLSFKYYVPDDIKITVDPLQNSEVFFIQGGRGSSTNGKLIVPAGLFGDGNEGNFVRVRPVPDSEFDGTSVKVSGDAKGKLYFPDFNGVLSFKLALRSPLVRILASKDMKKDLVLALSSDILAESSKTTDYCLFVKADEKSDWSCVCHPIALENIEEHKIAFSISKPGVYGVFYSPNSNIDTTLQSSNGEECGYYCENKAIIVTFIVIGIVAFIVLILALVMVLRYKKKLRISELRAHDYKNQVDEKPNVSFADIKEASQNSALYETIREKDNQILRLKEREEVLESELGYYKSRVNQLLDGKEGGEEFTH